MTDQHRELRERLERYIGGIERGHCLDYGAGLQRLLRDVDAALAPPAGGMQTGKLPDWTKYGHPAQDAIRNAYKQGRLDEQMDARLRSPAPQWTRVEDRLPRSTRQVLMAVKTPRFDGMVAGWWFHDQQRFSEQGVTHWQHITAPRD